MADEVRPCAAAAGGGGGGGTAVESEVVDGDGADFGCEPDKEPDEEPAEEPDDESDADVRKWRGARG